ncbi:MAG TPA: dTDP-4-dehydrorhamnose reductase [Jatrophihabitantaceae bacterium]
MTRWLITGAGGQLGSDLRSALAGEDVHAVGHAELDIADSTAVARLVEAFAPDVVVNAAAYTAVDAAESDEDAAYRVNATGPAVLAAALVGTKSRLVHVSTDYVFAGDADRPYEVDDPTGPTSAYGRTKLAGELAVRELLPDTSHVVRTAWVYGATGGNFVKTMARLERERDTVSVVDDQRGSPTWSADLAAALVELDRSQVAPGTYHCTNTGDTTWFGLTRALFEELGADGARVLPTTTDAFPRPAPRPAYSVLSDRAWRAAGLTPMPHWRDALRAAFAVHRAEFVGAG